MLYHNMFKNVMSFFKIFSLPILSGILAGTSYIPFPPWAVLFCFIPLWHFCLKNTQEVKLLFIAGWLTQFVWALIGFHWVAYTIHIYGNFNWFISIAGFLIFCSFAHLHIPLALVVWSYFIKIIPPVKFLRLLSLAVLISLTLSLPMLFQWNFGYTWFWAKLPIFHTAELWGFQFISTLTILLQICFFSLKNKKLIAMGAGFFFLLNGWGYILAKRLEPPNSSARILLVQHNIGSSMELRGLRDQVFEKISNKLIDMTAKALDNSVDFILWPEGAYPYLLREGRFSNLQKTVKNEFQTTLVTGASTRKGRDVTNSIFFIDSNGEFNPARYDKNKLLAFGEYIPGDRWFPKLRKIFLGSHQAFTAGKEGPSVRSVGTIRLGLQICYESLSDLFSRRLSQKGADVLVNLTNDSWFGWWYEPYQHLYMTFARGIELRKPIVRSTSTGISSAMSADGNILEKSPIRKSWAKIIEVPYSSKKNPTLFEGFGCNINFIVLLVLLLMPFFFRFYSKTNQT